MILHYEFIKVAKKFKDKDAIVDHTTGKTLSYKKALIASFILENKLSSNKEENVGILLPTSAGAMLSILASWISGKTPVMINYSMGVEENCEFARKKCNFSTIITSKAFLIKMRMKPSENMIFLEDILSNVSKVDKIKALIKSLGSAESVIKRIAKVDEDKNIVILFTSGSEKEPKAVPLTHKNIGTNVTDIIKVFKLSDKDIIFSILPLFHVFGFNTLFAVPITMGMTINTYANPLDFKKVPELVRETGSTLMASTPAFLGGYLREAKPNDFAKMQNLVAGADKLPEWIRAGYKKDHGVEVLEGYGATETSPVISTNLIGANKPGSIGQVMPSLKVKIISEDGKVLSAGEQGKILVKGDSVFSGYLDGEAQTKAAFIDGWYDTGDIGILDEDGFLWHKGRAKRFEKIGGEMVSLIKIENILEALLPSGTDCCVVGIPDEKKGTKLVAAITNTEIDENEIKKEMLATLPAIAVPKQFMYFDNLPKMGSGKIAFREIEKMVKNKLEEIKE
ncbi:MAG: AMP-binding protein [Spirochaetales bacterium]|nr:AMP-binding protein [Spirochaetales bacterium]